MSTGRDSHAAWIPVPAADRLPSEVADEIGEVSRRIGFVPNVARRRRPVGSGALCRAACRVAGGSRRGEHDWP